MQALNIEPLRNEGTKSAQSSLCVSSSLGDFVVQTSFILSLFLTLSLSVSLSISVSAQANRDSLHKILSITKNPSQKASTFIALCEEYRYVNPDSLFITAKELSKWGAQNNNSSWEITAEYYTALFYSITGNVDTALLIANNNIDRIKNNKEHALLLSKFYAMSGISLMRLNRRKDALERFYSGLQNAEKTNDKDAEMKAHNNIGWAYMELEQFEKAVENFKSSLAIVQSNNLPAKYGTLYNNLASCYGSLNKLDSAYKYANIGIALSQRNGDISSEANGYSIMGTFMSKENRYEEALESFSKAVKLREQVGDLFFIVSDMAEIAELQSKTGHTKEGIQTSLKALSIANENKIDAKLPLIYSALANNYEQAGMFKEAISTYKQLGTVKDSIYKDASAKALAEMQTKYETVKKEQKIEQQHNRIRLQNYLFIGIVALALFIGVLIYLQIKRNKLRQETKLKTELLRQQELAVKAVLEAEEKERQRIAKDLHDGVGQMMSAAKMNLSAFQSELNGNSEQKQSFEKIINLVDESCKEVRTVSHIMMPHVLMKNGLATAIQDFTDKLDKKALEVHLYAEGFNERLDSNIETVFYRVIQECVNNVIKHAQATTLDISLVKDKEAINATIEDNGKGFDTTDKEKFGGMGLKNIITRIEYLQGTVDFDSSPGRGTVVALYVPLEH